MSDVKLQPLPNWRPTITPGGATMIGIAIGLAAAVVSAFTPPRDFSCSFLSILLVTLMPFGGLSGYTLWLSRDFERWHRLLRISKFVAYPAILGILVAFAVFWRGELSRHLLMVCMILGFTYSMAVYAVGAGLGIVHLGGHIAGYFRKSTKAGVYSRTEGVWDQELDRC